LPTIAYYKDAFDYIFKPGRKWRAEMKAYQKNYAGLWIDHREAIVVSITDQGETIRKIQSDIERKVRLSGGSRTAKTPYGPQQVSVDGKQEQRVKRQLRQYYQVIIQRIKGANKILIFGPGEAKTELKKEIEKSKELALKKITVEATDKLTERQIAVKVRQFFANGS
jgi:stalled ribosome rescue protein Dom34